MHIMHVVGTRPNFPKCAPVYRALAAAGFGQTVLHSGQHYDANMSAQIIEDTGCPIDTTFPSHTSSGKPTTPQMRLDVLTGLFELHRPDLVMVYGDCNTAMEAATAAVAARAKLAHVEAGLRCGDLRMREETNRVAIDVLADILYVPSIDAVYNLAKEGAPFDRIQFVGNTMADSFWRLESDPYEQSGNFGVVTMHRPENVDNPVYMARFMNALAELDYPLLFAKHPRVQLPSVPTNVGLLSPLRYREFNHLLHTAKFVITDSGGVQEEATLEGLPCLTMRPSTERPITITEGTNELCTLDELKDKVARILKGEWKVGSVPLYWEGDASERIAWHLKSVL